MIGTLTILRLLKAESNENQINAGVASWQNGSFTFLRSDRGREGELPIEMAKGEPRDPNLDDPAVKMHRDIIHLRANYLQRACIATEIKNLRIWEATLSEWMLTGRNPKDVLAMIRLYRTMTNGHG
jgi:hypothetical protein